jgi:hypothetical protein
MARPVGFRRNMGLFMAVMIGIGATMGPGISNDAGYHG